MVVSNRIMIAMEQKYTFETAIIGSGESFCSISADGTDLAWYPSFA